jgi:DNA-binding MarR family transcriptional regulator
VIVDKLIDEGYVERLSDPKDRRIVNILITEKGSEHFESIKLAISENLKVKLSSLTNEEQDILAIASQQVREILISILSKE